jgi:hypothetical protein
MFEKSFNCKVYNSQSIHGVNIDPGENQGRDVIFPFVQENSEQTSTWLCEPRFSVGHDEVVDENS